MSQHDIQSLEETLNTTILGGDILGAFDTFYADDVVMQENLSEPCVGKAANRKREEEFVASVKEFHGADLKASAVSGDVSLSEWVMDMTFQDGSRKKLQQVAVRRWQEGQVVHERFYYDSAA
jgi:ketosteroid isomerase-like protein